MAMSEPITESDSRKVSGHGGNNRSGGMAPISANAGGLAKLKVDYQDADKWEKRIPPGWAALLSYRYPARI